MTRRTGAVDRRTLLATGVGIGATLLAGCSGSGGTDGSATTDGSTTTDGSATDAGTGEFRLLVSDQPAAIGDFESLDVALSTVRVYEADGEATATNATATTGTTAALGDAGVVEFDLDGETVDLTRVVGDRALPVLEDDLAAGEYARIELVVESAEGVVDGEPVDVRVPSGRLRVVRPFTVEAGESLSFVFDINAVRRGNRGYNLTPVIGQSGVAGEDVEAEEVTPTPAGDDPTTDGNQTTDQSSGDRSSGGSY